MAAPQGLFYFPGVRDFIEARFTFQHGISPSVCTLTMPPQPHFTGRGGEMQFTFGGVTLRFPDCIVDAHEMVPNEGGFVWQLTIFDRRWKWTYGNISGTYNLRTDDGNLIRTTEKTPQELCELCLRAMGEGRFDVSAVPNDTRPAVEWDYDNPAESLAELCDELRCRVVLGLDNQVRIWPIGRGMHLPQNLSVIDDSLTIDPPELPSSIKLVGGKSRFEVAFELEAVGVEADGTIKKIDDLKYKPTGGWEKVDLPSFLAVSSASDRELAKKSVFRWYRVRTPVTVGGYGPETKKQGGTQRPTLKATALEYLWQVLPLEDERVATEALHVTLQGIAFDPKGVWRNKPPQLHGKYWAGDDSFVNTYTGQSLPINATNATLLQTRFRIHKETGIVEFEEPKVQLVAGAGGNDFTIKPADFVLRTACSVRDKDTRAYHRYERERRLGNFGTGARIIRNEDFVLGVQSRYKGSITNFSITGNQDNRGALDREADKLLDQIVSELNVSLPYARTYAGLLPISPDGAIQQVTWAITESGAFTQASRNFEAQNVGLLGYHERRNRERTRGVRRHMRKLTSAHRAREAKKAQVN